MFTEHHAFRFSLLNAHDSVLSPAVPQVVKSCAEFIEKHGVVDGIYRLSGISSNIQKLRFGWSFDECKAVNVCLCAASWTVLMN